MPGTGRLFKADPKDQLHLMSAHLPEVRALPLARRKWTPGPHLDQGETSECTAYACTALMAATPVRVACPPGWPHELYAEGQKRDGFPLPHDGSTVRAMAAELKARGYVRADDGEYVWARGLEDVVLWLLRRSPVVVGSNWYRGMFTPDAHNRLPVTGPLDGGHAYLAYGVDVPAELVRIRNSWGRAWGHEGDAFLSFDDLARLLREDGEACALTEIRRPAA